MVRAVQDADSGEDHATFFPTSLLATLTLSQLLEKHVLALKGAVRLAKVNIDALPQLAEQFGVKQLPTVLALHDR